MIFCKRYLSAFIGHPLERGLQERLIAHGLVCLLARVRGKSPMDYLDDAQKSTIANKVIALIHELPTDVDEMCKGIANK
jgi:hypothetical protein